MNKILNDYKNYKEKVEIFRNNFLKLLTSLPKDSFVITDIATQVDTNQKDLYNIYIYFEPEKSKAKSLPIKFKTGYATNYLHIHPSINFSKDKLYVYDLALFGKDEPEIFNEDIYCGYVIDRSNYSEKKGFRVKLTSSQDTGDIKEFINKQLGITKNPILKDAYASIKQSILNMLSK